MSEGMLGVVGTGIKYGGHVTLEAQAFIQHAHTVFYLVNHPFIAQWIEGLNPQAKTLSDTYAPGKPRAQTYKEMIARILPPVRQGLTVCAIFYGHPGIFVNPGHAAIRQARAEGFNAWMMPGISAEDCLFADLGIDPARYGCQSFEATEFLLRHYHFNPHSNLILWQVGVVGNLALNTAQPAALHILTEVLTNHYPADHPVTIYEAPIFAGFNPRIDPLSLSQLPHATLNQASTLYLPPRAPAPWNREMMARLGIKQTDLTINY